MAILTSLSASDAAEHMFIFNDKTEPFSDTIGKQIETVELITPILEQLPRPFLLNEKLHKIYVHSTLMQPMPGVYSKMMTNQTWMCYWLTNAAILLKSGIHPIVKEQCNERIFSCFNDGGFGGGSQQLPHLASTYAAILTLVNCYNEKYLDLIDRGEIKLFLNAMKQPDGSFTMHMGGESDCRAVYCALVTLKILNIKDDSLVDNCTEYLIKCQTYEGGFSGEPGGEAHGGYTYCALMALVLLHGMKGMPNLRVKGLDLDKLLNWCVDRQYSPEGGLSGRTNKLVDACYAHWVGSSLVVLESIINFENNKSVENWIEIFNRQKLSDYILACCQAEGDLRKGKGGGLRDKPGMRSDWYHTCYALAGLSAMHNIYVVNDEEPIQGFDFVTMKIDQDDIIEQHSENDIHSIDPVFAVCSGLARRTRDYFAGKEPI